MKSRNSLAAVLLGLLTVSAVQAQDTIHLKVAGNLLATGLIQQEKEQPFFESLAETSGLPISVDYKPMDVTGIKDAEGLRVLKAGLFDIVSLRFAQVSRDEPMILGLDLVGLNPDYATGRKVVAAFEDKLDEQLQKKFNAKLLGIWPFGPQVLFCEPEISGLADIAGKKVRVYDQNLAMFVESVGGTPVPLGFGEVQQALGRGVVDCAITGPSSANSAGWPEVTEYFMPIGFQLAFNGFGINLDTWNKFTPEQQETFQTTFDTLIEDIWVYSEELFDDAVRCNVGEEPCTTVSQYDMQRVPVTEEDIALVQNAVKEISYPTWAEVCDNSSPGCSETWKASIGPLVGLE